jgi:hypothetical protein
MLECEDETSHQQPLESAYSQQSLIKHQVEGEHYHTFLMLRTNSITIISAKWQAGPPGSPAAASLGPRTWMTKYKERLASIALTTPPYSLAKELAGLYPGDTSLLTSSQRH